MCTNMTQTSASVQLYRYTARVPLVRFPILKIYHTFQQILTGQHVPNTVRTARLQLLELYSGHSCVSSYKYLVKVEVPPFYEECSNVSSTSGRRTNYLIFLLLQFWLAQSRNIPTPEVLHSCVSKFRGIHCWYCN